MEKRGLGHLEVVLSSVLFLMAIFVILILFMPENKVKLNEFNSEEIYNIIKENASVNLVSYSIKINNTNSQINRGVVISLNVSESLYGKNITVFGQTGENVNSSLGTEYGTFCINLSDLYEIVFFNFGEGIGNPSPLDAVCPKLNETYYQIASRNERIILHEPKILELNKSCNEDYSTLKKNFGVQNDLSFNFKLFDKEISCENKKNRNSDVIALNSRSEILRNDGKLEFADINIKIW